MNRFLQRISFALLLSLPLLLPHQANTQGISLPASGTYTQTFDNVAGGLPAGWTVQTGAAKSPPQLGVEAALTATPTAWDDATEGFRNMASADGLSQTATTSEQAGSNDRALGIRQSPAFGDPGAAFTLQLNNTLGVSNLNLKFRIQSLDASATRTTTWRVEYIRLGTTPQIYFPLGTSFTTGGTAFSNLNIAISLGSDLNNNSSPVRLRIISDMPTSGRGSRPVTDIDDVVLTYSTSPGLFANVGINTMTYATGAGPATEDFSFLAYYLTGAPSQLTISSTNPSVFTVSTDGVNFSPVVVIPYASGDPFSASIKVRLVAGLPIGAYAGLISVTGGGMNIGYFMKGLVTQTANQPIIATSPTALTGTHGFINYVGFKEKLAFIDLFGANLTNTPPGSYTITSSNPSAFQVSGGSGRSGREVISYTGVNPVSRTVRLSFIEGLGVGEYTGSLLIEGGGVTPITLPLSGTMLVDNTPPVITTNPTQLPAFSTTQGTPSAPQTFTLMGRNFDSMSGQINLISPPGFEVSLSPYSSYYPGTSIGINRDFDFEIRVRMTGADLGTFGGNITMLNTGGGSTATVSVSGRVNAANTQPLSVTALSYNCQTGALTFGRIGGDPNRAVEYAAVGVKSYSTDPNGIIDLAKRNDPNSGTSVTLRARYVGDASSEVSFNFDFGAYCSGITPPPVVVPPTPTPTPGTFAITGVNTIACQTITAGERRLTFSPTYAGLSGSPVSFSVVRELVPTTNAGPYTLNMYTDNPVITLKAVQQGTAGEANFTYSWLAACTGGVTPPVNQAPVVVKSIGNLTFTAGQRVSYNVASNFSDPEGQPLSFSISGLSSVPVSIVGTTGEISGMFSSTVGSPFSVTVIAADPFNLTAHSVFTITVVPATVVMPPTTAFAITGVTTVNCQAVTAGQRTLVFTPQYTGLTGSLVSFSVVNELTPTTNAGPYTLQMYTDNPTITLKAVQTGTADEAHFTYNWLAACNANARAGVMEPGTALQVRVLGNPLEGRTAEVEISGVAGLTVNMELTDLQGRSLYRHHIQQAGAIERVTVPVGETKSLLLLRVNTAIERQQVKLLKL